MGVVHVRMNARATRLGGIALLAVAAAVGASAAEKSHGERITPLLLAVHDAPMPFAGSGGRTHLVYELWITNFSSGEARVERVDVLGDGKSLATLDAASVAGRLQPAGRRDATATVPASGVSCCSSTSSCPRVRRRRRKCRTWSARTWTPRRLVCRT
jgi:hypothetical protein